MEEEKILFVPRSTLDCAKRKCIPCLYKIFPSGQAIIRSKSKKRKFTEDSTVSLPPNQRPENCFRAKSPLYSTIYTSSNQILTLGDGDLSFSLSLARKFRAENSTSLNLIATTYESHESLTKTYPVISLKMEELKDSDAFLYHGIDATSLSSYNFLNRKKFDFVIWNFPCIGVQRGLDGQVSELDQNKQLIRDFLTNVKIYLKPSGEVHVTHKTVEPFSWWHIEELAAESGFRLVLKIVFDRYNYPGYINRKALDKKSFPFNDARIYVFVDNDRSKEEDESIIKSYSSFVVPFSDAIDELQDYLQEIKSSLA